MNLIESIGRFFIVILLVTAIHLTSWYKTFEPVTSVYHPIVWFVCISIFFCGWWVVLPLFSSMPSKETVK